MPDTSNYFDLGTYSRPITTTSEDAQLWFDRGLNWCYAYNHEESVRCFEKVLEFDENCAMAYWGIAYADGCNYNRPWEDYARGERNRALANCWQATQKALEHMSSATDIEKALIQALVTRYPTKEIADDVNEETIVEDLYCTWNDAYADAMRKVYASFSDDLDVATLFAEALMNQTPWELWDLKTGQAAEGASTVEAVEVIEQGLEQMETHKLHHHPGLLHMYIHVMEMSPHPEKALRAADMLRDLVPEAGHLLHMPSHIDILCGQYYNAVVANSRATIANDKYHAIHGSFNFYTFYRCHDYHFKIYAAMFLGQYQAAITTVNTMVAEFTDELLRNETYKMADVLEGIVSMHLHVYIRFGKWNEIIDEAFPEDKEFYTVTTTMLHYAKAVAYAATGNIEEAIKHQQAFEPSYAKISETRRVFNNTCLDILEVAREMMAGEIEYRKGNYDKAFEHLRQSVYLDDNLHYSEPWGWMQPTRHALGALLLEQNRVEEALAVYQADLGLDNTLSRPSQHPDNIWSLHGYTECLTKLGRSEEATAMQARLDVVQARADVPIHASCFCRLEHQNSTNPSTCCDS